MRAGEVERRRWSSLQHPGNRPTAVQCRDDRSAPALGPYGAPTPGLQPPRFAGFPGAGVCRLLHRPRGEERVVRDHVQLRDVRGVILVELALCRDAHPKRRRSLTHKKDAYDKNYGYSTGRASPRLALDGLHRRREATPVRGTFLGRGARRADGVSGEIAPPHRAAERVPGTRRAERGAGDQGDADRLGAQHRSGSGGGERGQDEQACEQPPERVLGTHTADGRRPDLAEVSLRRGKPVGSTIARVTLEVRLGDPSDVDGAARVWARATAKRDGKLEIPPLEAARSVLLDSLRRRRSIFVVVADGSEVVGFASAEPAASSGVAEVRYVGVDPGHWSCGVGKMVLGRMAHEVALAGFRSAQLLVYADNLPARRLYERMGWEWDGEEPSLHPGTRRPEVRYRLPMSSQAGSSPIHE